MIPMKVVAAKIGEITNKTISDAKIKTEDLMNIEILVLRESYTTVVSAFNLDTTNIKAVNLHKSPVLFNSKNSTSLFKILS